MRSWAHLRINRNGLAEGNVWQLSGSVAHFAASDRTSVPPQKRRQYISAVGAADDRTYLFRKNNESRQLRANRHEKGKLGEGAKNLTNTNRDCLAGRAGDIPHTNAADT